MTNVVFVFTCFVHFACTVLMEVSSILNTGLDRDTLGILVSLCEYGVNPEALAAVVQELRREAAALQADAEAAANTENTDEKEVMKENMPGTAR